MKNLRIASPPTFPPSICKSNVWKRGCCRMADGTILEIENFERYVDENLNPLIDGDGFLLYEKALASQGVSEDAKNLGCVLLAYAIKQARLSIKDN